MNSRTSTAPHPPYRANPLQSRPRQRFLSSTIATLVAIAALAAPSAPAATWDGGSGVWSTSSGMWDGGQTWIQGSAAVFGGTAGTVMLGEAINASSIALNTNGYTIDLNGFDLAISGSTGGSAALMNTTTITNLGGAAATFSTAGFGSNAGPLLAGNLNVTYTGAAWNPSINHTFTGTLSLLGSGTVRSDGTALGSGTGLVRLGGTHTLQLGTAAGQFRTFTRDIELLNNTSSFSTGGLRALTLAGNISGVGEFRQSTTQGAIVLTGNNAYSGATYLTGAGVTLIAASNTAFGDSALIEPRAGSAGSATASTIGFQGGVSISGTTSTATRMIMFAGGNPANGLGALHSFGGDNSYGGNVTNGSNIARVYGVDAGSMLTLTGVVGGGKGIIKTGTGTLVLTGQNTYGTANATVGNETAVNDGILRLDFSLAAAGHDVDIVNFNNASNGNSSTGLMLGGGTLQVLGRPGAANSQRFKNNNGANNGFTINPGASTVMAIQNDAASLSMNLGQIAARNVGGTVNVILPTTGTVTLPTGTLVTTGLNGLISANGAAFMTVAGADWAARDVVNGIVAGSSVPGFYTPNDATTLSGNADMSGPGTTTLASSVALASLRFNNAGPRIIEATGQTLSTGGILVTANAGNGTSSISGGTLQGAAGTANQDLVVIQNNSAGSLAVSSAISDNVLSTGLTKSGRGLLVLAGGNTYTGATTLNEGVTKLDHAAALPGGIDTAIGAGESALVFKGGVLGLTAANDTFTRALGAGAGQVRFLGSGGFAAYGGDRTVNIGGTGAALSWNAANAIPTMSELILGAEDADGTVIFQNGINTLASASSPINRTIQVRNGSALVDARITGVIAQEGGIIKTGEGTLDLAAVNTHLGPTLVNAGTLLVSGSLHAGSPVSVNNGGTLSGSGVVNGVVTINAGGTLAPGSSAGTLAVGTALHFGAGSILAIEITGPAPGDGPGFYDQVNMTSSIGSVSVASTAQLTLALSGFTPLETDAFFVLTRADAGAFSTFFANASEGTSVSLGGGLFGTITYAANSNTSELFGGNDVAIYNVVPEPSTAITLLAGTGALLFRRRR